MHITWRDRLAQTCSPPIMRKSGIAAIVVGSILVLLNQGDVIVSGEMTQRVVLKSLLTPIIPFCVTLLGALLNSDTSVQAEALRPGWATIRRSLIIAVLVGSAIIALNQGDILLSGGLTPMILTKTLLTPCVPFCVSLYGAYIAYRNALAAQRPS